MQKIIIVVTLLLGSIAAVLLFKNERKEGPAPVAELQNVYIQACDSFFKHYKACLPKIPAPLRGGIETMLVGMEAQWNDVPKNQASIKSIETNCISSNENAKRSLARFGCEF